MQLKAAQLAVERVNSRGLARGEYKLKVIGFDLPADPAAAERAVENVMKDKSMLVMVLGRASAAKTLAPLADELEAPLVVASPNPLEAPLPRRIVAALSLLLLACERRGLARQDTLVLRDAGAA